MFNENSQMNFVFARLNYMHFCGIILVEKIEFRDDLRELIILINVILNTIRVWIVMYCAIDFVDDTHASEWFSFSVGNCFHRSNHY